MNYYPNAIFPSLPFPSPTLNARKKETRSAVSKVRSRTRKCCREGFFTCPFFAWLDAVGLYTKKTQGAPWPTKTGALLSHCPGDKRTGQDRMKGGEGGSAVAVAVREEEDPALNSHEFIMRDKSGGFAGNSVGGMRPHCSLCGSECSV